jgi:hypothetical protein
MCGGDSCTGRATPSMPADIDAQALKLQIDQRQMRPSYRQVPVSTLLCAVSLFESDPAPATVKQKRCKVIQRFVQLFSKRIRQATSKSSGRRRSHFHLSLRRNGKSPVTCLLFTALHANISAGKLWIARSTMLRSYVDHFLSSFGRKARNRTPCWESVLSLGEP